jgi:hypothetical protein
MTTKTIQLAHPFEVGGKTISEVTFRRPKARDMALIADLERIEAAKDTGSITRAQEMEASFLTIRAVTGLPVETVEELDLLAPPAQGNGGK